MRKGVFESMTHEEQLENMFLMDRIEVVATKDQLEDIGLDESYIGRTGYVDIFLKNNEVQLDLGNGELVRMYKSMIDEAEYIY